MRQSKWRQNTINKKWSTFNFDFTIKPLQKVCLQKIIEGTDVYAVLPTGYCKTILYTITTSLDTFLGVSPFENSTCGADSGALI